METAAADAVPAAEIPVVEALAVEAPADATPADAILADAILADAILADATLAVAILAVAILAVGDVAARIGFQSTLQCDFSEVDGVRTLSSGSPARCSLAAAFATVSREPGQALTGAAISGEALCEGRHQRTAGNRIPLWRDFRVHS